MDGKREGYGALVQEHSSDGFWTSNDVGRWRLGLTAEVSTGASWKRLMLSFKAPKATRTVGKARSPSCHFEV